MRQWHSNPQNVPKGMFSAVYGAVAVGKVSKSSSARSLTDILAPAYNKATSAIGREIHFSIDINLSALLKLAHNSGKII